MAGFFFSASLARLSSPLQAVAFFDGQNLYHAAKTVFGYSYPNYDPQLLAKAICDRQGWQLAGTRFYTGVPTDGDHASWNTFWLAKLGTMGRQGVYVFSRPIRYRTKVVKLPDGTKDILRVGEEKGVDVRIAIDVIRLAHRRAFDVAIVFSQDQDLSEVATEVREMAREQGRWIEIASAFPSSASAANPRGIDKTNWIRIDKATYDACLDPRDYRPSA